MYFRLSPLQKHLRKVVSGLGKKSVGKGVRKPGNTCAQVQSPYSRTILEYVLGPVLHIFLYMYIEIHVFETNATSDWFNDTV